ncbi:MAG: hypothetical protein KF868_13165 [Acidobacteria bacterium]|nr:hypothetical protein [Acidobacteriota bacterium]
MILLAVQCCAGLLASKLHVEESAARSFPFYLPFSPTYIYADLDEDHIPDLARVTSRGGFKSIQVVFGDAQIIDLPIWAPAGAPGALIAADIDRDRVNDLIWMPQHPASDAVIWFGSGSGRFEYAGDSRRYRRELIRLCAGEDGPDASFTDVRIPLADAVPHRYSAATADECRFDYPSTASARRAAAAVSGKPDALAFLPGKRGPPICGLAQASL